MSEIRTNIMAKIYRCIVCEKSFVIKKDPVTGKLERWNTDGKKHKRHHKSSYRRKSEWALSNVKNKFSNSRRNKYVNNNYW